jgi:hypothetical protein
LASAASWSATEDPGFASDDFVRSNFFPAHGGACARLAKAIPGKATNVAKDKLTMEQAEAIWNAKGDYKMEVATTRRKRGLGPDSAVVHS